MGANFVVLLLYDSHFFRLLIVVNIIYDYNFYIAELFFVKQSNARDSLWSQTEHLLSTGTLHLRERKEPGHSLWLTAPFMFPSFCN
jgi:hypothetical protein